MVSGLRKNYLVYLKKCLSFLFAKIFGVILYMRGMLVNGSINVVPQCNKYLKKHWIQEKKCFYAVNHNCSINQLSILLKRKHVDVMIDVCKITLKNIDY